MNKNLPNANNLDLLRFCFAGIVFLVHAYQLSKVESLRVFEQIFSSTLAVECFFVLSGFLIFMSYEKNHSINSYFEKRIRRIYPAYFIVVVGCGFLGIFISNESILNYLTSPQLYKYLLANLFFLNFYQPDLPGVFISNSFSAVNGALWTLKIEVLFYLTVPVIALFLNRIGLWQGLLITYLTSLIYKYGLGILTFSDSSISFELQRQLPGQMVFFIAGGALYYYFDWFKTHHRLLLILSGLLLIFNYYYALSFIYPLILAIIVVFLGFFIPYLGQFGKYGDFSYGIYILHFPILQTFIYKGFFKADPWIGLLLSTIWVLLLAFLLWHFVEKPMLRKSSYYFRESEVLIKSKLFFKRIW